MFFLPRIGTGNPVVPIVARNLPVYCWWSVEDLDVNGETYYSGMQGGAAASWRSLNTYGNGDADKYIGKIDGIPEYKGELLRFTSNGTSYIHDYRGYRISFVIDANHLFNTDEMLKVYGVEYMDFWLNIPSIRYSKDYTVTIVQAINSSGGANLGSHCKVLYCKDRYFQSSVMYGAYDKGVKRGLRYCARLQFY